MTTKSMTTTIATVAATTTAKDTATARNTATATATAKKMTTTATTAMVTATAAVTTTTATATAVVTCAAQLRKMEDVPIQGKEGKPTPEFEPEPTPEPTPESTPEPTPDPEPAPEITHETTHETTPSPKPASRPPKRPPPMAYFPRNGTQTASGLLRKDLSERPAKLNPVFDLEYTAPIPDFDEDRHSKIYYGPSEETGVAVEPPEPPPSSSLFDGVGGDGGDANDDSTTATTTDPTKYLVPSLARNERQRLTLLWYHTEGIDRETKLLAKIDTLVKGVQKAIGWEYAIAGIVNESAYTRLATANLPIAFVSRRDSTCSHIINQAPRSVFMVTDLSKDWRFRHSPLVKISGMKSYAGTQLRLMADDGAEISLGTLCVASSSTTHKPLSPDEQEFLVRFAELISSSIASHTRQRRLRIRQNMTDLLSGLEHQMNGPAPNHGAAAVNIVREVYPHGQVSLQVASEGRIIIEGRAAVSLSDVHEGIWEDTAFIEETIRRSNQGRLESKQAVRAIVARCGESDNHIVVASRDMHHVFDDFDAWFVARCATLVADSLKNQLLKQALEARETFMRGITHQLRTPIHGILGSVELLEEELLQSRQMLGRRSSMVTTDIGGDLPSPMTDGSGSIGSDVSTSPFACIAAIKNAGLELRTTINNILRHNHWNAGLRQCQPAPYDMRSLEGDILPGILSLLQPDQISGLSILFRLQFPGNQSVLTTDALSLRDSIEAIILNAIQAVLGRPDGSVVVKVQLWEGTASRQARLTVDVADNGHGIDPANHDKIFEPYEKVDSHKPGAGLGLTMAARVIDTLHGSVKLVSSVPGAGSCFQLELRDIVMNAPESMGAAPNREDGQADAREAGEGKADSNTDRLPILPRTFTDIRSGPVARHFMDHTLAYLEQIGFRHSDTADVGLVVTNVRPERVPSLIQTTYPDAVVIRCEEKEKRRGSMAPPPSGMESSPGCISLVGGPLHTQRLEEMLRMAEDMHQSSSMLKRTTPARKKDNMNRRTNGEEDISPPPTPVEESQNQLQLQQHHDGREPLVDGISSLSLEIGPAYRPPIKPTPIRTPTAPITPMDSAANTPPATTSIPLRALLVDDNPINLRILQMFCKKRHIPYVTATDGNKAVAAYTASHHLSSSSSSSSSSLSPSSASFPPDHPPPITLVFMDLQMPHCDGMQATEAIRTFERDRGLAARPAYVFMITGQDADSVRDGSIRAGADEFLVKPVGPAELDRHVSKYFPNFGLR